jgi:hypothetical protein
VPGHSSMSLRPALPRPARVRKRFRIGPTESRGIITRSRRIISIPSRRQQTVDADRRPGPALLPATKLASTLVLAAQRPRRLRHYAKSHTGVPSQGGAPLRTDAYAYAATQSATSAAACTVGSGWTSRTDGKTWCGPAAAASWAHSRSSSAALMGAAVVATRSWLCEREMSNWSGRKAATRAAISWNTTRKARYRSSEAYLRRRPQASALRPYVILLQASITEFSLGQRSLASD